MELQINKKPETIQEIIDYLEKYNSECASFLNNPITNRELGLSYETQSVFIHGLLGYIRYGDFKLGALEYSSNRSKEILSKGLAV